MFGQATMAILNENNKFLSRGTAPFQTNKRQELGTFA